MLAGAELSKAMFYHWQPEIRSIQLNECQKSQRGYWELGLVFVKSKPWVATDTDPYLLIWRWSLLTSLWRWVLSRTQSSILNRSLLYSSRNADPCPIWKQQRKSRRKCNLRDHPIHSKRSLSYTDTVERTWQPLELCTLAYNEGCQYQRASKAGVNQDGGFQIHCCHRRSHWCKRK